MATKLDQLQALAYVCRDFGGQLAIVSLHEFARLFDNDDSEETPWDKEDLSASPFTSCHGLWWRRKIVYAVEGREEVGSIIHEMGHVFASPHHPHHDCPECTEWNWFGWEIAVARQVDAWWTWSRQNSDYFVGDIEDGSVDGVYRHPRKWGQLSNAKRKTVVAERLAHARTTGILDASGVPRSVR